MGNIVKTCLLIYTFIFFNTTRWCSCKAGNLLNNSTLRCIPSERAALLSFKHNLTYFDKEVSSSWEGEECCEWSRVLCDNTGNILELILYGNMSNNLLTMEKRESFVYLLELRQLKSLDLSFNNFSYGSIPIFMGLMKQLRYLDLSFASLGGLIPYELGNLTNLQELDLYNNMLTGEIPASLGKLSNLTRLDLSHNNLSSIAAALRFPSKLESLDLSYNQLSGKIISVLSSIASSLSFPSNLDYLDLSNNQLSGKIPTSIGKFSKLRILDISNNPLEGTILSESHFVNLSSLKYLVITNTMLTLNLSSDWVPPFQLQEFHADNCKIIGQLPPWLQTQKSLSDLSLSNASISGPLLEGLGHIMPNLQSLFLSNNQISGQIPNSLCQLTSLIFLDISNNSLSGEIPNCFANISSLTLLHLSYNKLTGHIPFLNTRVSNKSEPSKVYYLYLNDNMFSGEIPSCLGCLSNLRVLDIGGNQLSGKMLSWFSDEKFKKLKILRLRGNKFSGPIPRQICSLPHLQLLDLGHNHFTGSIPRCLSNLTAMTTSPIAFWDYNDTSDAISVVIQGIERAYTSTLPYLVDIDLSSNNLAGSIPDDITKIFGLLNLNLSYNQLSGIIPVNIGGLKSLVSLDLSKNNLMGSIPTSIGQIYTLSHLNLSYNNLSGPIPPGNQLQTLSDQASIYAGNPYLCGDALPKKCKSKINEQGKSRSKEGKGGYKEKLEKMELYLVVMSGFATGFWGVVGCLVLNRRWRHAVFRRLEDGYNWFYVILVLKVRMVKAKINRR